METLPPFVFTFALPPPWQLEQLPASFGTPAKPGSGPLTSACKSTAANKPKIRTRTGDFVKVLLMDLNTESQAVVQCHRTGFSTG